MESSPLNRLAPELRNQMYDLVLCSREDSNIYFRRLNDDALSTFGGSSKKTAFSKSAEFEIVQDPLGRALLQSCKQIHREAKRYQRPSRVFRLHGLTSVFGMLNEHRSELEDALLVWYDEQVRRTSPSPRAVKIDLSIWNVKENTQWRMDCGQSKVCDSSIDVVSFFERRTLEYTIEMDVDHTESHEYRIGSISIPITDPVKVEERDLVTIIVREESKRLKEAWADGNLTMEQYSTMQMGLKQFRNHLGRLVCGVFKR